MKKKKKLIYFSANSLEKLEEKVNAYLEVMTIKEITVLPLYAGSIFIQPILVIIEVY